MLLACLGDSDNESESKSSSIATATADDATAANVCTTILPFFASLECTFSASAKPHAAPSQLCGECILLHELNAVDGSTCLRLFTQGPSRANIKLDASCTVKLSVSAPPEDVSSCATEHAALLFQTMYELDLKADPTCCDDVAALLSKSTSRCMLSTLRAFDSLQIEETDFTLSDLQNDMPPPGARLGLPLSGRLPERTKKRRKSECMMSDAHRFHALISRWIECSKSCAVDAFATKALCASLAECVKAENSFVARVEQAVSNASSNQSGEESGQESEKESGQESGEESKHAQNARSRQCAKRKRGEKPLHIEETTNETATDVLRAANVVQRKRAALELSNSTMVICQIGPLVSTLRDMESALQACASKRLCLSDTTRLVDSCVQLVNVLSEARIDTEQVEESQSSVLVPRIHQMASSIERMGTQLQLDVNSLALQLCAATQPTNTIHRESATA